jgi:hypothetical protein
MLNAQFIWYYLNFLCYVIIHYYYYYKLQCLLYYVCVGLFVSFSLLM